MLVPILYFCLSAFTMSIAIMTLGFCSCFPSGRVHSLWHLRYIKQIHNIYRTFYSDSKWNSTKLLSLSSSIYICSNKKIQINVCFLFIINFVVVCSVKFQYNGNKKRVKNLNINTMFKFEHPIEKQFWTFIWKCTHNKTIICTIFILLIYTIRSGFPYF